METEVQARSFAEALASASVPRDVVRMAFRYYAPLPALSDGIRTLTYADVGERVLRMAALWREWGLGHGSSIFCVLPDGIDQVIVRLAAAEAGAMLTMLPANVSAERLALAMGEIEPVLIVHGSDPLPLDPARDSAIRVWAMSAAAERELAAVAPRLDERPLSPDALLMLGFTSGTTGVPKVLAVSHGRYLVSLKMLAANIQVKPRGGEAEREQVRMLVGVPLTGAGSGLVLPSILGGGLLIVPERYDSDTLLKCLAAQRASRLFTTPSLLIDMLDDPNFDATDLSTLRQVIYGTELMPVAKLEEALRRFGPILQQGYGSSEVLPPVCMLGPEEHVASGDRTCPAPRDVLMSAGRAVRGVDLRIVGENGADLPPGAVGDVLIKSPTVFSGYWRRPDLTSTTLRDGYLVIGDTGFVSADGSLTLLGRRADLVRRDGRVIYPRLVEEPMHDDPAVKEASLVQVGDRAVMAVSLRRNWRGRHDAQYWRDHFLAHLADRVSAWQMPDDIALFEELPRSPLGKVLRREVRIALEEAASKRAEG